MDRVFTHFISMNSDKRLMTEHYRIMFRKLLSLVICGALFLCGCSSAPEGDRTAAEEDGEYDSEIWVAAEHGVSSHPISELAERNAEIISASTTCFEAGVICEDKPLSELADVLSEVNASPVYSDTVFCYFSDGEEAYQDMLEAIREARDYIFLEYFLIDDGSVWDEFEEALAAKVKEGVEVRILVDGIAIQSYLPRDFIDNVESEGISIYIASPITRGQDYLSLMRDHRKMLVVDGKVVYTGGINIADEYANRIEKHGHWKDNAIRLEGECVKSFVLMFLQMWELFGEETEYDRYLSACEKNDDNGTYCMPYFDSALDEVLVGREVYRNILENSEEEVRITTPYFTPDDELLELIKETASRGVHVTMVFPGIPDRAILLVAARTYYGELAEAGVDIYEYTPGFLHQKVFVCDGCRCSVGSVNLDNRSLDGQYECGIYMYSEELAEELNRDIDNIIAVSRHVTGEILEEIGISGSEE